MNLKVQNGYTTNTNESTEKIKTIFLFSKGSLTLKIIPNTNQKLEIDPIANLFYPFF